MPSEERAVSEAVRVFADLYADQQVQEQYWVQDDFANTRYHLMEELEYWAEKLDLKGLSTAQQDQETTQQDQKRTDPEAKGTVAYLSAGQGPC